MIKMPSVQMRKRLLLAAIIVWMLFIWGNSMIPAPQSVHVSNSVAAAVAPRMKPLNLTWSQWSLWIRKIAHMLEFCILSILLLGFLRITRPNSRWLPVCVLGICCAAAFIDEGIQLFSHRMSRLRDVGFDSIGALAGVCLYMGVVWCSSCVKRKRELRSS